MQPLEHYFPGDRVTNSLNWSGIVQRVEDCPTCKAGIWILVYWKERETHTDSLVRKHPIIGHLANQIRKGGADGR